MSDDKAQVSQRAAPEEPLSPRQKALRQGVMLMLLSVILIPGYILLAPLFPANDRLVESSVSDTPFEKVSQAILVTIFLLGLARVIYAYFFQRGGGPGEGEAEAARLGDASGYALPAAQSIPASGFGAWRADPAAMVHSSGVDEPTTDLKDNE